MTTEQHATLSRWSQFGPANFVHKVARGCWIIPASGASALFAGPMPLVDAQTIVPVVFRTKRQAMDYVDNLICLRAREWRGHQEA